MPPSSRVLKKLLALLLKLIFLHHNSQAPSSAKPQAALCRFFPWFCTDAFLLWRCNFLFVSFQGYKGEKEGITSWGVSQLTPHGWHCPITLGLISYLKLLVGKQGQNLPELTRWDLVILCIYLGSQLHYYSGKKSTGYARKQWAAAPGETLSLLILHMLVPVNWHITRYLSD